MQLNNLAYLRAIIGREKSRKDIVWKKEKYLDNNIQANQKYQSYSLHFQTSSPIRSNRLLTQSPHPSRVMFTLKVSSETIMPPAIWRDMKTGNLTRKVTSCYWKWPESIQSLRESVWNLMTRDKNYAWIYWETFGEITRGISLRPTIGS